MITTNFYYYYYSQKERNRSKVLSAVFRSAAGVEFEAPRGRGMGSGYPLS